MGCCYNGTCCNARPDPKNPWLGSAARQTLVSSFTQTVAANTVGMNSSQHWKCYKMKISMSRKGDCWDNAPTESFWGRLKVGRLYGRRFETRRQAMDDVIDWMTFYNHRRIHSTLGYVSPMQFEKSWHAAQLLKAA